MYMLILPAGRFYKRMLHIRRNKRSQGFYTQNQHDLIFQPLHNSQAFFPNQLVGFGQNSGQRKKYEQRYSWLKMQIKFYLLQQFFCCYLIEQIKGLCYGNKEDSELVNRFTAEYEKLEIKYHRCQDEGIWKPQRETTRPS